MNKIFNRIFILIAVSSVFIACQNPSDPSIYIAPGTGLLSLSLDKEDTARTILPDSPKSLDFALFELKFFYAATKNDYITETLSSISTPISLAAGSYDLYVTAYADSGRTSPGAQGSIPGIMIPDGGTIVKTLEMTAIIDAGGGTFRWDIDYPGNVTTASMIITPLNKTTGTPEQTVDLTGAAKADSCSLNAGYYRVGFYLRDDKGQTAELKEILHVYQNLTSTFTYAFNVNNFHFLKVKQVIFPAGEKTTTVYFDGLSGNDIYLVKINTSASTVSAAATGGVYGVSGSSQDFTKVNKVPYTYSHPLDDFPGETELYVNLPIVRQSRSSFDSMPSNDIGVTRNFYIREYDTSNYIARQVKLAMSGVHSNIWLVDDENCREGATQLAAEEVENLSLMFDKIYFAVTNILGYEYGGGPNGDGGVDGDTKIQIVVSDIGSNVAGFFSSKDLLPNSSNSNSAEMFYVDAEEYRDEANWIYLTLAHEFQHLINYSQKVLSRKPGVPVPTRSTWYNEMMSMMTEDAVTKYLELNDTKLKERIGSFLSGYYKEAMTEFTSSNNGSYGYGNKWAFGSYLLRNYGGAELLAKMMKNEKGDIDSIMMALNEIYEGLTFEQVLTRFGEFMILNSVSPDAAVMTFNKDVTSNINGVEYHIPGYDIWEDFKKYAAGPAIFPLNAEMDMKGYTVLLQSDNNWKGKKDSFSIKLNKPEAPNVMMFLMVK